MCFDETCKGLHRALLRVSHEIGGSVETFDCKDRATLILGLYMDIYYDQSLRLIIQRLFGLSGLVGQN